MVRDSPSFGIVVRQHKKPETRKIGKITAGRETLQQYENDGERLIRAWTT